MNINSALQLTGRLPNSDTPRLDLELLLAHSLQQSRVYLRTWPAFILSAEQEQQFLALLRRRETGEPIAYILGQQEFWSLPLQVNPSTLIPRPDTERLVELALQLLPDQNPSILDLGTGTGAIALALASERPDAQVTAVDVSQAACELAQQNALQLGVSNLKIIESHWFEAVTEQFSLIVSNPPYLDADDPHLPDLRFEPTRALVADEAGLKDLRHIIQHAPSYLTAQGWLLLEHGWQQGLQVRTLMAECRYTQVKTYQDYGGNDRVTLGQLMKVNAHE